MSVNITQFNGPQPAKIVDGTDPSHQAAVSVDGAISVDVASSTATPHYNEITSVAAGVESTVITVTASTAPLFIQSIDVSGDNIALFRVKIDGTIISLKRTYFVSLNESFKYGGPTSGISLNTGSVLTVTVEHTRPSVGKFESTVLAR